MLIIRAAERRHINPAHIFIANTSIKPSHPINMANTYTQLYIHTVFAVQGRQNLLAKRWRDEVFKYITGIVTNKGQKLMCIGGVADHVHMLVSMTPDCSLSDLMETTKANSSRWINDQKWVVGRFEWQRGYGGFSVSKSKVSEVCQYIESQEEHHRQYRFRDEYRGLLNIHEVAYDPRWLLEDFGLLGDE